MSTVEIIFLAVLISILIVVFNNLFHYTLQRLSSPKPIVFKDLDAYELWIDEQQENVNTHYERLRQYKINKK